MINTQSIAPETQQDGQRPLMVPPYVKARRRARNKQARVSRRINRRAGAR